jgi:hypothetical protein
MLVAGVVATADPRGVHRRFGAVQRLWRREAKDVDLNKLSTADKEVSGLR